MYRFVSTFSVYNMGQLLICSCGNAGATSAVGIVFENNLVDMWYNDTTINMVQNAFVEADCSKMELCNECLFSGMGENILMIK